MIPAALILAALACQPGASVGEIVSLIEDSGGTMIELVDVNGQGFDQLLVAEFKGQIVVGAFSLGCVAQNPYAFGPVVERTGV